MKKLEALNNETLWLEILANFKNDYDIVVIFENGRWIAWHEIDLSIPQSPAFMGTIEAVKYVVSKALKEGKSFSEIVRK